MKKTEYILRPCFIGKQLQFKSQFNFLWLFKFTVWRYVPYSYVSGCFKEKDCPFLYLPFTVSHCFYHFLSYEQFINSDFLEKYSDINTLFRELKKDKEETEKTYYI